MSICEERGHDWQIFRNPFTLVPIALGCKRCGWAGDVTMEPEPQP